LAQADGDASGEVIQRLGEIGKWMNKNGEAFTRQANSKLQGWKYFLLRINRKESLMHCLLKRIYGDT
jgi:hypothetical protein